MDPASRILQQLKHSGRLTVAPEFAPQGPARGGEHRLSGHVPLWSRCRESLARPWGKGRAKPLFGVFAPGASEQEVAEDAGWAVFFGGADSAGLRSFLSRKNFPILVLEPEKQALLEFLASIPGDLMEQANCLLLWGDITAWEEPLSRILLGQGKGEVGLERFMELGFPVFYVQEGFEAAHSEYLARLRERLELLYYRKRIYPLDAMDMRQGLPVRPMRRELYLEQQAHLYENIPHMARAGSLKGLAKICAGRPAVLVGAGPDLGAKIEYLRRNQGKALVLAVNSALKPLAEQGIAPHVAVISDNGPEVAETLRGLPVMGQTLLVCHHLSHSGGEHFPRKVFFGDWDQDLFGPGISLRIYGSVISAAFSLALYLGCGPLIFVGAQLASEDTDSLAYARGSFREKKRGGGPGGRKRSSHLVPVRGADGSPMHTSLNFLDAAEWLLEEIRRTRTACVNTTPKSLLHGPGIMIDPEYDPASAGSDKPVPDLASFVTENTAEQAPALDKARLARYLEEQEAFWRQVRKQALPHRKVGPGNLKQALAVLQSFEGNNVSYLVQRFQGFDNPRFHEQVFETKNVPKGLEYYYDFVARMAGFFLEIVQKSCNSLK